MYIYLYLYRYIDIYISIYMVVLKEPLTPKVARRSRADALFPSLIEALWLRGGGRSAVSRPTQHEVRSRPLRSDVQLACETRLARATGAEHS